MDDIWITQAKQLNSGAAKHQGDKIADTPEIVDDKLQTCKIVKTSEPVLNVDDLTDILQACQSNGISEIVGIVDNKLTFILKAHNIDETSEIGWILDDQLTYLLQACKIGETSEIRWIVDTVWIKCLCDLQSLYDDVVNVILDNCVLLNNSDVATKDCTAETVATLSEIGRAHV